MPFESIESNFIEIRIANKTWKCRLENVVNIWFKSRWVKTEHNRSFITGRPIVARQNNVLHFEIKLQWRDSERDGVWNPQNLDWPVNSLHKGPVTRKMFPFDDVIMNSTAATNTKYSIHLEFTRGTPVLPPLASYGVLFCEYCLDNCLIM